MKLTQLPLFVVFGICVCACSPKLAPQGHYQDTPVTADGKTDDWHLPLRFTNEKYTYQYNVTNDNKSVYICVLSSDNATVKRILKDGMTLYFDKKGKNGKDMSISFPIRKDDDDDNYNRYLERNGYAVKPASQDSTREKMLRESNIYNTRGFVNLENGQFGTDDTKTSIHLALRLNNNDSTLVYEAVVPINIITGSDLTPKQAGKNFSVGIELNSVPAEGGGEASRPRGGGMHGGGMGMGMGMGMMRGGYGGGGGGNRGGNGGRSQGSKAEDTWYQFRPVYH